MVSSNSNSHVDVLQQLVSAKGVEQLSAAIENAINEGITPEILDGFTSNLAIQLRGLLRHAHDSDSISRLLAQADKLGLRKIKFAEQNFENKSY